jgi:3-isopropylmalate/(R)-2-methylmalate dehydratase small subunit
LLTVILPEAEVERLWQAIERDPTTPVTVDLVERQVRYADVVVPFEIDDYTRWRLLEGLDDIGLTLRHADDVEKFEQTRPTWKPRTLPAAG